ncbi:cupin domain-containing protein [Cognatilysobacter bugurensis]|uniref:Cupin n=1 Tax=Cognatilysobacter bugurensis TaxID=543356 RepID=A0A918T113_9GAMM|nr:cupin domain-containing protein [Lysobacter bugurensis]GHA83262.1 cupin [Lysobacter bugurensis]
MTDSFPIALATADVPPRATPSLYPEPFASLMHGREKRVLGDRFGLQAFGVNLTRLEPGARSALRHAHSAQDEFVYIVEGHPTLHTDAGPTPLAPGMCAGFRAGSGDAHCLVNDTATAVLYLEVGDRSAGDRVQYPDDDLAAHYEHGAWRFTHKDGAPY